MPSRKVLNEKARRRKIHDAVRALANEIVSLKAKIETIELRNALPLSPYRETLGWIEEYYNQVADEFDDIPDEPPLQTLLQAYERVRTLHKRTVENPGYIAEE